MGEMADFVNDDEHWPFYDDNEAEYIGDGTIDLAKVYPRVKPVKVKRSHRIFLNEPNYEEGVECLACNGVGEDSVGRTCRDCEGSGFVAPPEYDPHED